MTEVKTVFSGNAVIGGAAGSSFGLNMGATGSGEGLDLFEKEEKAPVVESVTLTPSPAVYNSTLTAVAKASSGSFDFAPRLAYEWKRNGVVVPNPSMTANTFPPGSFIPRDTITVTVTAYVGAIRSEPKSASVSIWHPSLGFYVSSLTLSPASPSADAPITATATTYIGGPTFEPDYIYTWKRTRAGETRTLYENGKTLSTAGDIVIPGDIITVSVCASYLGYTTPPRTASVTVVEFPVIPVVQSVTLLPTKPFPGDPITATVDVMKNGDLVPTLNYEWTVTRPQPEGQAPLIILFAEKGATLSTQEEQLLAGDIVTSKVTASYGEGSSAPKSTSVTIRHIPVPAVRDLTLSPIAPLTGNPITAAASVTDTLGYALDELPSLSYVWTRTRKGITTTLSETGQSLSTLGDTAIVGDIISVTVVASLGELHSEPKSASVTIANSPIKIKGLSLNPRAPFTFDNLVATVQTTDPDRTRATYSYAWTRNGVATQSVNDVRSSQNAYNLNQGNRGSKGDLIEVTVTASDGQSTATAKASVTVRNSVPVLSSLTLTPLAPTPLQTVTATYQGRDADGDALTKVYKWRIGTKVLASELGSRLNLVKYPFIKAGNVIRVDMRLSDGTALSKTMAAQVTVVATAPRNRGAVSAPALVSSNTF